MIQVDLPEILNVPPKIFPLLINFNNYNYFLLEGGRASGKTQSVARFLLYIAQKRFVRICCGREIQNSINESVKTVFLDLIEAYKLDYLIRRDFLKKNPKRLKDSKKFLIQQKQTAMNMRCLQKLLILLKISLKTALLNV